MNLLFIVESYPSIGGTEKVTSILAGLFEKEGIRVGVLALKTQENYIPIDLWSRELYVLPDKNREKWLADFVRRFSPNLIVNQGPIYDDVLYSAFYDVPLVSVLHYAPDYKLRNSCHQIIKIYENRDLLPFKKQFIATVRRCFPVLFSYIDYIRYERPRLLRLLRASSAFIVLAEGYEYQLKISIPKELHHKVRSIENPMEEFSNASVIKKDNVVIYVGRLTGWDKRPDRLMRVWEKVSKYFPTYKLIVVGDGPERHNLEIYSRDNNLTNVLFVGATSPTKYYKIAKVICITSDSEGAPMVINEARSYGVVPIAINVSQGIESLITDGKNGVLVPNQRNNEMALVSSYAQALIDILHDTGRQDRLRSECLDAYSFNVGIIAKWTKLFNELVTK